MRARIWVYTQRKGLLARAGHDLKLYTDTVTVRRDGPRLHAEVDASSLMVVCAMKGDKPDKRRLSERDRGDIHRNLHHAILDVSHHPTITFDGQADSAGLSGALSIRGQQRPVSLPWTEQGEHWVAEGAIDHRDFGIPLFKALMGTLQVDPRLRIQVRLPPQL